MSKKRSFAILAVFILILSLTFAQGSALAATGIAQQGEMTAKLDDNLFIAIKNQDNAALNVVPAAGGDFARVDYSATLSDLIAAQDHLFYLRGDGAMVQLIKTSGDGSALEVLVEWDNALVDHLSYYNEMLYVLVNGTLTIIDPENGDADEVNSEVAMSEYAIVNDVVYFASRDDQRDYSMTAGGQTATGTGGKLYLMPLIPSPSAVESEMVFDQGVSHLQAHGNYLYMRNMADGYPTADSNGAIWIEGKLYRMDLSTRQLESLNIPYDWYYKPTDSGLMVYSSENISLYPLGGGAAKKLMSPETNTSVSADDENAYVFEHSKGILTQVPLAGGENVTLYDGGPIVDLPVSDNNSGSKIQVDENGDPVLDEDGNPVYVQSDEIDTTDTSNDDVDTTEVIDDNSNSSGSSGSSSGSSSSAGKDNTYIFSHSNRSRLTRQEILNTSKSYWRRARNEIYARHGYKFKESSLQKYFEGKSWYKPGGFSESALSALEWDNMNLILAMEKEYGLIAATSTSSSSGSSSASSSSSSSSSSGSSSSGRVKLSKNVFSNSSTKKLTRSQLSGLSKEKLARARNEILARHGFPFQQAKWQKYFKGTGWKSNKNFSYNSLNKTESYNIDLIKEYE